MKSDHKKSQELSPSELIGILGEDNYSDYKHSNIVKKLLTKEGNTLYSEMLYHLTHMRFAPIEAKRLWNEILQHKYELNRELLRNIGIRVATLDFFLNIEKKVINPKIIEAALFEDMQEELGKDSLTGLFNYRSFKDRLQSEVTRSKRYRKFFSLIIFDLDGFKSYNDKFGHKAGDEALKKIALVMQKATRESDFVARYGGEEFVVILVESDKRRAYSVAERIRRKISELPLKQSITVSGGLATFLVDSDNGDGLFQFADKAVYKAKREGKNKICLFYEDRRKFLRIGASLPITIKKISKQQPKDISLTTTNVSCGGVAFITEKNLPVSSFIEAVINFNKKHDIPFKGKIVRIEETHKNQYEAGVKFLKISKDDKEALIDYVAGNSNKIHAV